MKWPETDEPQVLRQTQPRQVSEGRRMARLASSRTGEKPPYGMNRAGGGNIGMTRGLFATMPERADTQEALGLKPVAPPPHSTSQFSVSVVIAELPARPVWALSGAAQAQMELANFWASRSVLIG
jgi:hypothetical protein